MNLGRHWGVCLSLSALVISGCSDDGGGDHGTTTVAGKSSGGSSASSGAGGTAGGASNGGTGGGSSVTGGSAGTSGSTAASGDCRSGGPSDPDLAFAELAGKYTFTPSTTGCKADNVVFAQDQTYGLWVSAAAKTIDLDGYGDAAPISFVWDGKQDLTCHSEFTDYLEVDGHGAFIRVTFVNKKPSAVVLGLCLGKLANPAP
jgi:hypothetical protein